jgi:hypothetical protein
VELALRAVPTVEAELAMRLRRLPQLVGFVGQRERENSGAGIVEEGMASAPRSRYMTSEVGGLASNDSEEGK